MEREDYFFNIEENTTSDNVFVLIIYDIADNKKRLKLSKMLLGYGFRIRSQRLRQSFRGVNIRNFWNVYLPTHRQRTVYGYIKLSEKDRLFLLESLWKVKQTTLSLYRRQK